MNTPVRVAAKIRVGGDIYPKAIRAGSSNVNKKANLILQLQKFSFDKANDSKSCNLNLRQPKDFGPYQNISTQIFQK